MPLSLKIFRRAADRKTLVGERVLNDERITVGRGADCTLILEDPARHLSRLHAEFERTARGYLLRVMSAGSPVVVNGVSYFQGGEVAVHAGDTFAMAGYDLEIVSVSGAKPAPAATSAQPSAKPGSPPQRATGPVTVNVHSPAPETGSGRGKRLVIGAAAVAGVIVLALAWPAIKGLLPDGAEQKKAEQTIARLEGEARSLLKLVDSDRREIKEATAASSREIERVEALVRSTRTSQDRLALDAAVGEARRIAKASFGLEDKVRERLEGPAGLPKAEGNLSAAAAAAKGGDRAEAIRLFQETVASLTQMRLRIAEDRKTTQAELEKRREDLLTAETRAIAEAEARARAEAEAKAKAQARAQEASHTPEAEQAAQSAQVAALPCLGKLAGTWSHPVGGTWTFAGNQGTRVVESGNHGPKARQITVINMYSCAKDTVTYKVVRLALVNPDDPGHAYDRTAANTPNLSIWAKLDTQRYAISNAGLRFGSYTYARR